MSQSLRERAFKFLKSRRGIWINGGEMERLALAAGYKGSTVSRELRHLAENGDIERRMTKGRGVRSVEYRHAPGLSEKQENQKSVADSLKWFAEYKCQCVAPKVCTKHV